MSSVTAHLVNPQSILHLNSLSQVWLRYWLDKQQTSSLLGGQITDYQYGQVQRGGMLPWTSAVQTFHSRIIHHLRSKHPFGWNCLILGLGSLNISEDAFDVQNGLDVLSWSQLFILMHLRNQMELIGYRPNFFAFDPVWDEDPSLDFLRAERVSARAQRFYAHYIGNPQHHSLHELGQDGAQLCAALKNPLIIFCHNLDFNALNGLLYYAIQQNLHHQIYCLASSNDIRNMNLPPGVRAVALLSLKAKFPLSDVEEDPVEFVVHNYRAFQSWMHSGRHPRAQHAQIYQEALTAIEEQAAQDMKGARELAFWTFEN